MGGADKVRDTGKLETLWKETLRQACVAPRAEDGQWEYREGAREW